jgi:dTDP-4-amino-4,6-dideoxygalactose transaminase
LPDTFNLDPASCERAVATAKRLGLKPRAVIPVDLFGLPANHGAIADIAEKHGLKILDDAAQGFGASYRGRKLGTFGAATATSFFPAKPLGCYGDGGAVLTDDDVLAARVKSIRLHGEGVDRSEAARIGITGRLDTIQAAILIEKLKIFPDEIAARDRIAARYSRALADVAIVPRVGNEFTSVWAQYTVKVKPDRRDVLAADLKAQGIPTAIYYTRPLHRQPAYRDFPIAEGGVPVSEQLSREVISLPMHAYLEPPVQDRIIGAVRSSLAH